MRIDDRQDLRPPLGCIETVALISIVNGRVLLARPRGNGAFYMPGGKRADREPNLVALKREIHEELRAHVLQSTVRRYGVFEDQAYNARDGVRVRITCYLGELDRSPIAGTEIEELRYFSYDEHRKMPETAPAVNKILLDLSERDLIE